MIDRDQLRLHVVRPTLQALGLWSAAAENLVIGTIAQESRLGTFVRQINGPALGICQMEPATHDDIWRSWLRYQPALRETMMLAFVPATTEPDAQRLVTDMGYAVAMCRLHYRRVSEALPSAGDVAALARYWKLYYNTMRGRGTEAEFIQNYRRFVG